MFSNNFTPIKPHKFDCEKCDFHTCNKKDFTRHTKSIKHIRNENSNLSMLKQKIWKKLVYRLCGKEHRLSRPIWI